ncbi:MAG TPA: methyltransferase domain-containing protein [Bryobacteraceae bacterium]|nr:methyltransferase domain-containing protein [Bryobacteraceae bacterium]
MANPDIRAALAALSLRFRGRRMLRFAREYGISANDLVLDIGGTPECWQLLDSPPRVVMLNLPQSIQPRAGEEIRVAGDGCLLPFRDGAFDIVFSNSVIEHLGSPARQEALAREAARVGRGYWIQTPNRWFPVEQHLMTPFLHWLPKAWQRALAPRFNFWNWLSRVTPDRREFYIRHFLADILLLGPGDLRRLFPDARLIRERFWGVTKSLIAMRRR